MKYQDLHVLEFSISHSLSSYEQDVPVETQKPQLYYCPDDLLVKLSAFQAEHPGLNPACANFYFFLNFFTTNWYRIAGYFRMVS